ncbi:hypothetical protein H4R24_003806 [Coemansia sp. RSA 988]|nr:hypothetical protein H4R24_003806 [Coemansia sp. RSA 988]
MDNNSGRFYIHEQTDISPDASYHDTLETPAAGVQQLTASTNTPATRIAAAAVGRRLDLGAARPPQFALHQPQSGFRGSSMAGTSIDEESAFEDGAFTTPVMDYHRRAEQGGAAADGNNGLMDAGTSDLRSYGYLDETPSETTNHGNKPPPRFSSIEQQIEEHSGFWSDAIDSPQQQQYNGTIVQQIADGPPTPFGNQSNEAVDEDFMLNLNQEGDLERLTRKAMNDANGAWKQLTMNILRKQLASLDEDEWMYVSDCR